MIASVDAGETIGETEFRHLLVSRLHAELVAEGFSAFSIPASMLQLLFVIAMPRSMRHRQWGSEAEALFQIRAALSSSTAAATAKASKPAVCSCWWCDREQRRDCLAAGRIRDMFEGEEAVLRCGNPACSKLQHAKGQFKRCAKCKAIAYCSAACQKAHWRVHKAGCNAAV